MENPTPTPSQSGQSPAVQAQGEDPPHVDPEMARKMAEKRDIELLDMFESPDDWKPEALEAAKAELQRRNVPIASPVPVYDVAPELSESPESAETPRVPESQGIRAGMMCVQHAKVQATQQCRRCGAYMCATCDFAFPGGIHLCPICVSKTDDGLSSRRKKYMIWSYVLAVWSTVGMTCLVSGAISGLARTRADRAALGWVLLIFVLGPAIAGLSLGVTAKRKQGSNPPPLWIAIIWNAILVASFVVLMLIGIARR